MGAAAEKLATTSAASDLLRVIRINEEIKKVVAIAGEVNLTALNAKFMAHRSGARSVGFGVVSTELRAFSKKMDEHMENLRKLVFEQVKRVALVQKQARLLGRLQAAVRKTLDARFKTRLQTTVGRKQRELDDIGSTIQRERWRFKAELARALKLCRLGSTFAQRAKVEAVYGRELSGSLTQVSNQVEAAVDKALTILKAIKGHIED